MKIFSKKEKPVENLAFIGICSAITVVFVTLLTFFSFLSYFFALFIPLIATFVALFCKYRYYPIYAFSVTIICVLLFFNRIELTVFTLIPSLITGFLFGFFFNNKLSIPLLLLITSIVHTLFLLLSICTTGAILGKGFSIEYIKEIFGYPDGFETIFYSLMYLFSLAQAFLSLVVAYNEMQKFTKISFSNDMDELIVGISIVVSTLLIVLFAFVYNPLAYLFMTISIILGIYLAICLINKKQVLLYILLGFLVVLSLFLFAGLYQFLPDNSKMLLLNNLPLLVSLLYFVNLLLFKRNKKDKIE